jgi:large subunit ribosomal protein L9
MTTEVLLMADVKDLGEEGDIVTVADGYARNFLFPKKKGAAVSDVTKRQLVKIQEKREVERAAQTEAARKQADKLSGVSCTIPVKTDDEDKMYGSVAAKDILEALKVQGVELEKNSLQLEHPIKELGVFDIVVKLDKEIEATIKVWVVEE